MSRVPWDLSTVDARMVAETVDGLGRTADKRCTLLERIWHHICGEDGRTARELESQLLSSATSDAAREDLLLRIRDPLDPWSSAALQIKFSFSIPTVEALATIATAAVGRGVVSAGAGVAYWEWLLSTWFEVDICCFDANTSYPEQMRFTDVQTGGPDVLADAVHAERVLLLAWPDTSDESLFGVQCLSSYRGTTVVHVGETFGETLADSPWGQSTSQKAQEMLASLFRRTETIRIPRWPGHTDAVTVWQRIDGRVAVGDGVEMCRLAR